jgi:hypothetical protein
LRCNLSSGLLQLGLLKPDERNTPRNAHIERASPWTTLTTSFCVIPQYERRREDSGQVTEEDLVVYFLKECVRIPMKNNAFHLIVSIGRILHNYSTRAVMNMYGAIAPKRAANKNDEQCRRWKATITDALETRFQRFVMPHLLAMPRRDLSP